MHREVPPLGVTGRLFSATYVCSRSIDRSAPVRTIFGAFSRLRECSEMASRDHVDGTCRAEARLYMKTRRRLLAFVEFFVCAQHHRSTVADSAGQVSTGRKYRSRKPVLGSARGAIFCCTRFYQLILTGTHRVLRLAAWKSGLSQKPSRA